ncbi:hypothetical protein EWB00_000241 [Schistosoma japonicum]|uniref:Uncharacterized protein n=1 Tax=Schistosoma japonicum TaxID=6182 RepID=A0A4Z2CKB8_SCHJA|nr:hypothetical protein EWB00_000241 [Schistosoma japonicum]
MTWKEPHEIPSQFPSGPVQFRRQNRPALLYAQPSDSHPMSSIEPIVPDTIILLSRSNPAVY